MELFFQKEIFTVDGLYECFETKVQYVKTLMQFGVGAYILFFIALKVWVFLGGDEPGFDVATYVISRSTLELISQAMMVSAAIELAYMLYTPGPDEAIDPLILGITGGALYALSDSESKLLNSTYFEDALVVILFSIGLLILFFLRYKCQKWFPKEMAKDKLSKHNNGRL